MSLNPHITTKLASDATTWLHRFECHCGRRGAWLERRHVAEENGRTHIKSEHGEQERVA